MGSTIPICQFGLSLVICGPVLTLSILTVFYIYVDGVFAGVTGLSDGFAARDEDGGGGGPCDMYCCACMYLGMIWI